MENKTVIAFKNESQAYVLPVNGQPKYVSIQESENIESIDLKLVPGEIKESLQKCGGPAALSCFISKQNVYVWWMKKSEAERLQFICH